MCALLPFRTSWTAARAFKFFSCGSSCSFIFYWLLSKENEKRLIFRRNLVTSFCLFVYLHRSEEHRLVRMLYSSRNECHHIYQWRELIFRVKRNSAARWDPTSFETFKTLLLVGTMRSCRHIRVFGKYERMAIALSMKVCNLNSLLSYNCFVIRVVILICFKKFVRFFFFFEWFT